MSEILWEFNNFMDANFKSLAMGLTPSGHIHLGFLTTLACALMYLKEHPSAHLIITNVENSLSSRLEKYSGIPLRFQSIEKSKLLVPKDYGQIKKRNRITSRVHGEVSDLVWKLSAIFDEHTAAERKQIKDSFIPPKHKAWLNLKENKVFHIFGTQIYFYSFLNVLKHDKKFRTNLMRYLTNMDFARAVAPMAGLKIKKHFFGNRIKARGKVYRPTSFQVPIMLYCPNCHELCPKRAEVVSGHPYYSGPVFTSRCMNVGECLRADEKKGYDGYIYHKIADSLDLVEFHFMLDPMRDFFQPFWADCHIFGGDYFQLEYEHSGKRAIEKIQIMFDFLEGATGQKKYFFGGPLVTTGGIKMAKSGTSLNIKDIKNLKKVFTRIVKHLEKMRAQSFPGPIKLEYSEIIDKAA